MASRSQSSDPRQGKQNEEIRYEPSGADRITVTRPIKRDVIEELISKDPFLKPYLDALPVLLENPQLKIVSVSPTGVVAAAEDPPRLFEKLNALDLLGPAETGGRAMRPIVAVDLVAYFHYYNRGFDADC
jgi:hypothetical protein